MHSTANSETAGAALVMTGMGTGVAGIPMITPTTGMGMEAAGTTMTTITRTPPMIGMGTARGRIMVIQDMEGVPPMAVVPIPIRIMAGADIRARTHRALAPFFPPFWALSSLAIKAGAEIATL